MYLINLLETMKNCMKSQQSEKLSNIFGDKIGCSELLSPMKKLMKSSSSHKSNSFKGSKYLNEIPKDIIGIDSEIITEQLTLMQFKLYCEIHALKDKNKKYIIAPNIDQFNKITKWIQLSILNAKNIKHGRQTIKRWIKIEEYLCKINNLMGVTALKWALNCNAIYKLKYPW